MFCAAARRISDAGPSIITGTEAGRVEQIAENDEPLETV